MSYQGCTVLWLYPYMEVDGEYLGFPKVGKEIRKKKQ